MGLRAREDRGELGKVCRFTAYQYVLWPLLAGSHWKFVLLANLTAVLLRNLLVSSLQMASSVGHEVATLHHRAYGPKSKDEWIRFQIETSKNYRAPKGWWPFLGGLDRHIEHHLFPALPPLRLHELSEPIRELCRKHEVRYAEFSGFGESMKDSLSYLQLLARPGQ